MRRKGGNFAWRPSRGMQEASIMLMMIVDSSRSERAKPLSVKRTPPQAFPIIFCNYFKGIHFLPWSIHHSPPHPPPHWVTWNMLGQTAGSCSAVQRRSSRALITDLRSIIIGRGILKAINSYWSAGVDHNY